MYSQIFVLTRRYHSPSSPDRLLACSARVCECIRVARDGCSLPFFQPSFEGWNSFHGPTPSVSHEWHRSIASIILTLFLEAHPFSRSPTILGAQSPPFLRSWFSILVTSKSVSICRNGMSCSAALRPPSLPAAVVEIHHRRYTQKSQMDSTYVRIAVEALLKSRKGKKKTGFAKI